MGTTVVIVSCRFEWRATLPLFPGARLNCSPFGEWFETADAVFVQGGWGKISAAASAQYVIDRWSPSLVVNLGTCGGIPGRIGHGDIVLVERTVVYDIFERMTGADAALAHYATELDLSWLPAQLPQPVRRAPMVSADRDLDPDEAFELNARFGSVAADWESGAIAWVAARNGVRCLILRGVSDLAGEAYGGNLDAYVDGARQVMENLVAHLPAWVDLSR